MKGERWGLKFAAELQKLKLQYLRLMGERYDWIVKTSILLQGY
jgi:hypothetical protein